MIHDVLMYTLMTDFNDKYNTKYFERITFNSI